MSDKAILNAVLRDDAGAIEQFHRHATNLNIETTAGQPLLTYALVNRCYNAAIQLIACGADVDAKGTDGFTPLTTLCWGDETFDAEIRLLGDEYARLDLENDDDQTPLKCAIHKKNFPNMQTLLELGADPNGFYDLNMPPLVIAINDRCIRAVEMLLSFGADPDSHLAARYRGDTPLMAALRTWEPDAPYPFMECLLQAGADVNLQGIGDLSTPFLCALAYGHAWWAEQLVQRQCHLSTTVPFPMPDEIAQALDVLEGCPRVGDINALFFGSGEPLIPYEGQITHPHPIARRVLQDHQDHSLTAIVRRYLRKYLSSCSRINLIVQVQKLPITEVTKSYLLFQ